jgi:voltage-gated potassium channel
MRSWRSRRTRPGLMAVGLLLAYYAVPVAGSGAGGVLVLNLVLTVLGLLLLGAMMVLEVRTVRRGGEGRTDRAVAMMLMLLVFAFALTFYLVDQAAPTQLSGLSTRTDALYFTLSTMTTVGFGDVHAEGQVARVLVSILIVFSVVVVASLVRAHTRPEARQD